MAYPITPSISIVVSNCSISNLMDNRQPQDEGKLSGLDLQPVADEILSFPFATTDHRQERPGITIFDENELDDIKI
ncbi:unnamed protein product [Didymodactylos carnosus]|uniref:Uncharacterized protein n=2 Tax=Didymodactylos carnosus TaxID=1234261 RepID=A0A814U2N8_9BILA|nr:unnamed protein product [Didymodactylos carnosus]CAF3933346.1 unnamed protein product [Didymodactylos carnosus]